jgi:hypothetical protein
VAACWSDGALERLRARQRHVSSGDEYSLIMGIENSLVGAAAASSGTRPGTGGFRPVSIVRPLPDGSGAGGPTWRTSDDIGSTPPGPVCNRDRPTNGPAIPRRSANTSSAGSNSPPMGRDRWGGQNKIAPFVEYLRERVAAYPDLSAVRLTREIRERGRGLILACRAEPSSDVMVTWLDDTRPVATMSFQEATVAAVHRMTHDILRIKLRLEDRSAFRFAAGQYLRLEVEGAPARYFRWRAGPTSPTRTWWNFTSARFPAGGPAHSLCLRLTRGTACGSKDLRDRPSP